MCEVVPGHKREEILPSLSGNAYALGQLSKKKLLCGPANALLGHPPPPAGNAPPEQAAAEVQHPLKQELSGPACWEGACKRLATSNFHADIEAIDQTDVEIPMRRLTKLNSALENGVVPSQVGPPVVQTPLDEQPVPVNTKSTFARK
ncbi:hypothetical protein Clacol_008583 [Clathrus columnatus]|uniref:Uncharacterized protein n=1 Tax=Clathrus columnatus TaxID=1419009 RepID=A0AAV5ANS4_9AGAM|nr:hypothetical protein Clacol_008583 [Clathrus columnatus]